MSTLQQPLQTLSSQCKLPLSGPQALQLLQGMQGGGLPAAALGANNTAATTPSVTGPTR
jgi:heme-binding protein